MNNKRESHKQFDHIDLKRKKIFNFILFLFPFFILFLIEVTLRILGYGENYNLFKDYSFSGKSYRVSNHDFGKKYFNNITYTTPMNELFLKAKPENAFRIFVIGSSTVVGFPYSSGIMFPRILQERLQDCYPDKKIEVINTAMTAINSYTFYDKINEILAEKPDAILIYGGQNEFYGALGVGSKEALGSIRWIKILHLKMMNFKIYQMIRNMIFGSQNLLKEEQQEEDHSSETLMHKIAENKSIEYKSQLYLAAHDHYKKNMSAILRKARKKNVPVFFSELICNVKDLAPFGSIKEGNFPQAAEVYNNAISYVNEGNYEKAKDLFYFAKDLDCIRYRASEDINLIIKELTDKYNTFKIPMKTIFEKNSPNGLIGNELLTEHVHPNIEGYFLMADAFYNSLVESNIIGKLDSSYYKPSSWYRENWGYTELDSVYADILIRKLKAGWPFKPDSIVNTFMKDYKAKDIIDSLAYQTVRYEDIKLESSHKKLAQYYIIHNQPSKAYKEYLSAIKINPFDVNSYTEAGEILLQSGKINEALNLFLSSLEINEDIYILSKIGEIYVQIGDYKKAIVYLEKVNSKDATFREKTILNLLYNAYNENGDKEKADNILSKNRDILTQSTSAENRKEIVLRIPAEVKGYIDQAVKYLRANEIDKAFSLLNKANEIRETSAANRFLGDILLQRKDKKSLYYLKKVYADYSSDANYLNTLCYACIYFKDFKYAEKILPELKQLSPNNPNISNYEKRIRERK